MVKRYIENEVEERGTTGARLQAADFGQEAIGRGIQSFGQSLGVVAEGVDAIAAEYDTAAVKKADAEDLTRLTEIRGRVMASQGFEAQEAIKTARQELEELKRSRLSTMKNPRQQRMYEDIWQRRIGQIEETFTDHGIKQTTAAEKGASAARLEASVNAARDTYGTAEFEDNMATAIAEVRSLNRGAGPDALNLAVTKVRSQVLYEVLSSKLDDPENALDVEALIDEHAPELLPEHEDQLRKRLYPIIEDEVAESDAGWAFSGAPVPGEKPAEPRDPLAPLDKEEPTSQPAAPARKFDPIELVPGGRVTDRASNHRARGSSNGIDIAAKVGTPIRPPMSGKVIFNDYTDKGGWTVLVEHPNGYVTGYAHMRAKSPLAVGAEIERGTTIGGVGSTGRSSGPHLHFTVRKGRGGPKVDPETATWAAEAASGSGGRKTDPKTVDWNEGKYADYSAGENEKGDVFARLRARAQAEGWSTRRYNRAVARASQIAGVREAVASEQYEETKEGAIASIAAAEEGGSPIMRVADVKNFGLLKPNDQLTILNMIQANQRAAKEGEANAADADLYMDLMDAQYNPARRQEFMNIDFRVVPGLTKGQRQSMMRAQAQMRAGDQKGDLGVNHNRVWSFVSKYQKLGSTGFKVGEKATPEDRARQTMLLERVGDRVAQEQASKGRPLTDDEMDGIVRGLVVEVTRNTPGLVWGSNQRKLPRYIAEQTPKEAGQWDTIGVPAADRNAIVQAYRRQHNGKMPTSEEITRIYMRQLERR